MPFRLLSIRWSGGHWGGWEWILEYGLQDGVRICVVGFGMECLLQWEGWIDEGLSFGPGRRGDAAVVVGF